MFKSTILVAIAAMTMAFSVAGCASAVAKEKQGPSFTPSDLAGTTWVLTKFGSPASPSLVASGARITLLWNSDTRIISGSAGCNGYSGEAHFSSGALAIRELIQTQMYCFTPGVMAQEESYLALLAQAQSWSVNGARLTIICEGGEELVFEHDQVVKEPAVEELAGTSWKLISLGATVAVAPVLSGTTITLNFGQDGNQISGSGGVNGYAGLASISGISFAVSEVLSTLIYCDNPAGLMAQEDAYLGLLRRAESFELSPEELTIYCAGGELLLYVRV